jgi:CRP-like cAMP-binding protein
MRTIRCEQALKPVVDIPFLKNLSQEQLDLIAPRFERFVVPAGTVIFQQGDEAAYLYIILRGTVTIRFKPYDGPQIVVTHLHAGDVFGWSSVIGNKVYTSGVISKTELEAVRVLGANLRQLCVEHPTAGCAVLEKLAEAVSPRWKNAKDEIQNMLKHNVGHER